MKRLFLSILGVGLLLSGNANAKIIKLEKCIYWSSTGLTAFMADYPEYLGVDIFDNEEDYQKFINQKWSKKAYDFYNTAWFNKETSMLAETKKVSSSVFTVRKYNESSFTINTNDRTIIRYAELTDKYTDLINRHYRFQNYNYNKKNSTNVKTISIKRFKTKIIELTGDAGDRFFGVYKSKTLPKIEYTFDLRKNEIIQLSNFPDPASTSSTVIKCKP